METNYLKLLQESKENAKNTTVSGKYATYFQDGFEVAIQENCKNTLEFTYFNTTYHKALQLARKNKLGSAQIQKTKANRFIDLSKTTGLENLIFLSVSKPIDSYLEFKLGNYDKAIELLEFSIAKEVELESTHPVFLYHRIQQVHNIWRVYARLGDKKNTKLISKLLFNYFLNEQNIHYKDQEFKFNLSDVNFNKLMAYQVFFEVIVFFKEELNNSKDVSDLYSIFGEFNKWKEPSKPLRGVYYWLKTLESQVIDKEINYSYLDKFIKSSTDFWNDSPHKIVEQNLLVKQAC